MVQDLLFQSDGVVISPCLARFGSTSYQIANISLVRVGYEKRFNPLAVILFAMGAALLWAAYGIQEQTSDARWIEGLIAAGLMIASILCQKIWPKQKFTFVMKANSGDIETFITEDRDYAVRLRLAIEQAFAWHLLQRA